MKKYADDDYRTKDGQGRVVKFTNAMPNRWHAQEMMPGGHWMWVDITSTKAEAIEALKNHTRQFIW